MRTRSLGGPFVRRRPLMRVVLDDPDPAALVHRDSGRRQNVRLAGDQLHDEAGVGSNGRFAGSRRGLSE